MRVSNEPNNTTELFASVTHLPSYTAIYKPRYTGYSLDTDYRQDLINSNSKFFNDITDYANILINNLQSQLFVVAYYKGDRNLTNIVTNQGKKILAKVRKCIEAMATSQTLSEIPDLEPLKGFLGYYRIKFDYSYSSRKS